MNDKNFKKMDETWMKKIQPIRDKKVSEGMLKGFSASVERRIASDEPAPAGRRRVFAPVWAPVMAVMVLASLVVLRSPIISNSLLKPAMTPMELAQAIDNSKDDVQEEIEVLKALGVWDEVEDEKVLGSEEMISEGFELTQLDMTDSRLV